MAAPGAGKPLRVAVSLRERSDLDACHRQLSPIAEVVPLPDRTDLDAPLDADVAVIEVDPNDAASIVVLERFVRANQHVPVVAVGRRVDAELAVEIVYLLAHDFLSLPLRGESELRAKIERLLRRRRGPTIDRRCLAPLRVESVQEGQTDRRHVFRAVVPSQWTARAHVRGSPPGALAVIEDLSIPHQGWPGALLLKADRLSAQAIVKSHPGWGRGYKLELDVEVEGDERSLPLRCKIVRVPRPRGNQWFYFAVEYTVEHAEDNDVLRRFWMDCQTRAVESDPERTPRPGGKRAPRAR